jgi:hypothetical protein
MPKRAAARNRGGVGALLSDSGFETTLAPCNITLWQKYHEASFSQTGWSNCID